MEKRGSSDNPKREFWELAVATHARKSGIDLLGDMPWGTHFCLFYETKEDLLATLVPYFKAVR